MLFFKLVLLVVKLVDVDEELLLPSVKFEHFGMMESFRAFVVTLVSLDVDDAPGFSVKPCFVLVDLPEEGIEEDTGEREPAEVCP